MNVFRMSDETRMDTRMDLLDRSRFRTVDIVALIVITGACVMCSTSVIVTGDIVVGSSGYFVLWLLGCLVVVSDWRHRVKNWRIQQLEDEIADLKADWRQP